MADGFDILKSVKQALRITGNYQDSTFQIYINDIKGYLKSAGVKDSVINSETSAGVIARGVADVWNNGKQDGILSPFFYERVIQLATVESGDSNV